MYVITGGAGFIGSALLWQLNRMDMDEIVVVDNLAGTEKWRNLVKRRYVDYLHRDRFYELIRRDACPGRSRLWCIWGPAPPPPSATRIF